MQVRRKILLLCSKKFGLELSKQLIKAFPEARFTILHPNDLADERSVYSNFRTLSDINVEVLFAETKKAANDYLTRCDFDLCLVCGWYWIILVYFGKQTGTALGYPSFFTTSVPRGVSSGLGDVEWG